MSKTNTSRPTLATVPALPSPAEAVEELRQSFERLCLSAGLSALQDMLRADAEALCGARHARGEERQGHRWGTTRGPVGFHGGKTSVERPRVRGHDKKEIPLPSWEAAQREDWLGQWAMNQMLLNVATRRFARSVRLPEGDIPVQAGDGTSKSAASRRFVALSAAKMDEWMSADLSQLDLLAIQIDGLHIRDELVLIAAVGIDEKGEKHPLAVVEGATENTATVQALLDNLTGRGLDPKVCRLFIVDGAKALVKAIRNTFGSHTPIQRC
ncbi:MAG: transposase [Thioclava sp.]|nr:transposase [Thioclava sp.]